MAAASAELARRLDVEQDEEGATQEGGEGGRPASGRPSKTKSMVDSRRGPAAGRPEGTSPTKRGSVPPNCRQPR
eukprot:6497573-Prymnesium_polylepis.2